MCLPLFWTVYNSDGICHMPWQKLNQNAAKKCVTCRCLCFNKRAFDVWPKPPPTPRPDLLSQVFGKSNSQTNQKLMANLPPFRKRQSKKKLFLRKTTKKHATSLTPPKKWRALIKTIFIKKTNAKPNMWFGFCVFFFMWIQATPPKATYVRQIRGKKIIRGYWKEILPPSPSKGWWINQQDTLCSTGRPWLGEWWPQCCRNVLNIALVFLTYIACNF